MPYVNSVLCLGALALCLDFASAMPVDEMVQKLQVRDDVDATTKMNANRNRVTLSAYTPDCTDNNDPSYAIGKSMFNDGDGVRQGDMCDNGLTTAAVARFHCW